MHTNICTIQNIQNIHAYILFKYTHVLCSLYQARMYYTTTYINIYTYIQIYTYTYTCTSI